jgi:spore maturation protein CgeB
MRIVIFGLTITSSWGNGHATLWRGLCKALTQSGHEVEFFERDTPYYAANRDFRDGPYGRVIIYHSWDDVRTAAHQSIRSADAVFVTSYCPDAVAAGTLAQEAARGLTVFYDLDAPVTLARLEAGDQVDYLGPEGLSQYDLVLSFTGGAALEGLRVRLGARVARPLYGHVDPDVHHRCKAKAHYAAAMSYLGTYSSDRQATLERLFVWPARARPDARFLIGGAQYPQDFPWSSNIFFVRHLPPPEHAAFFSSSRLTLNLTRSSMARMGWCPSGRLFEAAACGVAMISDAWEGLDHFFEPGSEILVAQTEPDVLDALDADDAELARVGRAARERVFDQHTSQHRARELCTLLEQARRTAPVCPMVEV